MGIGDDISDDPLARFYEEEHSREAGIKDPVTGIRTPVNKAEQKHLRHEEGRRKEAVKKRILVQLMNDDLGREWLYDLLHYCGVFRSPYADSERQTVFNSGAHEVGRFIESALKKVAIQEYFLMIREGWEREKMFDDATADRA